MPKWGMPEEGKTLGQINSGGAVICNIDMAVDCNPENLKKRNGDPKKAAKWIHSYFIGNSLKDTYLLYEKMVERIGSTIPKEARKDE